MSLPLTPPLLPQLARPRATLPEGEGWAYEPKWDGFRAIAYVDGGECYLQSRNGKPLSRYFPEVSFPAGRYVIDGELVAASFDTLDDDVLLERSYEERRALLETIDGLELTPVARDADGARQWLQDEEGVIAK